MSVDVSVLTPQTIDPGCYRRKIAFNGHETLISNKKDVFTNNGNIVCSLPNLVFDILANPTSGYAITSRGNIYDLRDKGKAVNLLDSRSGLFAGLERTDTYLAAGHDLSHSIRFLSVSSYETVSTKVLPGILYCMTNLHGDLVAACDDHTVSIIDPRDLSSTVRSTPLPSQPSAIFAYGTKIFVGCEDRRVRIFDQAKIKTPIVTTKPTTKNAITSLYTNDGRSLVVVGNDESITLVETERTKDVGQLHRCKYLAESPFVSMPVEHEGRVHILTRGGSLHSFSQIVDYMKSLKAETLDDD